MGRKTRNRKGAKKRTRKASKQRRGGAVAPNNNHNNAPMNYNMNVNINNNENYNNLAVGNIESAGGWQERAQAVGDFLRDLREGNPGMGYIIDQWDQNYMGPMFAVILLGSVQDPHSFFHQNCEGQPIDPIAYRDALLVEIENLYGLLTANQARTLLMDLQDYTFREMEYTVPENQGGDFPIVLAEGDMEDAIRDTFPQGWAYYEACKNAL